MNNFDNETLIDNIFVAIISGNFEELKKSLKMNPLNIHAKNSLRQTVLMSACIEGDLEIVKYLLTSSELTEHANLNDKTVQGWTPLMFACGMGRLNVVKYLLSSEDLSIVSSESKYNENINLLEAAYYHKKFNVVNYLILEKNIMVKEKTLNEFKQDAYDDIVNIIEKRDLNQSLQKMLNDKERVLRKKI